VSVIPGRGRPRGGSILKAVERICPFLALSVDHRTAVDGFDPDHFCHALDPAESVDRARQAEFCLVEAHRQCERYVAFLGERGAVAGTYPTPAPDAHLARTRLILDPQLRRAGAGRFAPLGRSPRRWLVAGSVAAVGVAAAATAVAGGFNAFGPRTELAGRASPTVTLAPSPTAQPTAEPTAQPTAEPTEQPTTQPSANPSRPPRSSPSAAPEAQTYVVKEGDTLSLIADRFGTSVEAILQANGLSSDVINIGQELVIP
jgi:LysM repeat protein